MLLRPKQATFWLIATLSLSACGGGTPDEPTPIVKQLGELLEAGDDLSKSFDVGSYYMNPRGGNGGDLSYESSKPEIATIDDQGMITLVGIGTTTLVVTEAESAKYFGQSDSYELTVVKGIGTLLSAGDDVTKGYGDGAFTQAATGGNSVDVSYASSDLGVATVDDAGMVTIVGLGSTEITATEAASMYYQGQSDSYILTVGKGAGEPLSAGGDVTKRVYDDPFTQTASGGNNGAISYSSSDTGIAEVDAANGMVTIVGYGDVTITATEAESEYYQSQSASYQLTVLDIAQTYHVVGNSASFAALRADGSVVTWGADSAGGDSDSVSSLLDGSTPVAEIFTSSNAYAALRADGSVVTWGSSTGNNSQPSSDKPVVSIATTSSAFAAIRSDGTVATWGDGLGGDSSAVSYALDGSSDEFSPVVAISGSDSAFAALHENGSVTTWGNIVFGGDSQEVSDRLDGDPAVVSITGAERAFAALHEDGSVTTWGNDQTGGNQGIYASALDGTIAVTEIISNGKSFAALRADGSVISWGIENAELAGSPAVVKLFSNNFAFAALRSDGSVTAWGDSENGGDGQLDGTPAVIEISSTSNAFAALHSDGSVTAWGNQVSGGGNVSPKVDDNGNTVPVVYITGNDMAFAALNADGSMLTWGNISTGGNGSDQLDGTLPVVSLSNTDRAFSAVRANGSVVSWGESNAGGDSSGISEQLSGTEPYGLELANCTTPYPITGLLPCAD